MKFLMLGGAALSLAVVANATMQDGEGLSPEELQAKAEALGVKPQAGKYSSKIELLSIDVPDAPPQVAGMMKNMLSRTFDYCLTQEDVEEGFKSSLSKSQQGDCRYERFDVTGVGEIEGEMVCNADGREMRMVMEGSGTPTSSDVTMQMSGDMGVGPGSMTMRVIQNRIGDC